MKAIRAVIFDMDGVLIDSEPCYMRFQYEQLKPAYPWITLESLHPLVGMSSQEYLPFMAKLCKREGDPALQQELDEMNARCKVDYARILRPQVPTVLQTLHEMGLKIALASSSSRPNIEQVLRECEITHFFDCVVSGYEFEKSKPDPQIYQYTMQQMGCEPNECLIVEDSTYGVAAGVAAGGIVAALRDARFPFDQRAAQMQIDSLAELPAIAACGGRQIRAAFFDVDGTLIEGGTHQMPTGLGEALERLRQNGIEVYVCTGRHRLEIEEEQLLPGLAFDGAVYMNGQICERWGELIWDNPIAEADLCALQDFLEQSGRSCIFLEKDRMYANRVDAWMQEEQANIGTSVPPVGQMEGLSARAVYQVIPFVTQEEEKTLLARMKGCRAKRWGDHVVDVMSVSGGKEKGITALCQAMGITPQQIIAFGDAENDLEMLQLAGIGVAMGNAQTYVQAHADLVTDRVEQGGVINALRKLKLL